MALEKTTVTKDIHAIEAFQMELGQQIAHAVCCHKNHFRGLFIIYCDLRHFFM